MWGTTDLLHVGVVLVLHDGRLSHDAPVVRSLLRHLRHEVVVDAQHPRLLASSLLLAPHRAEKAIQHAHKASKRGRGRQSRFDSIRFKSTTTLTATASPGGKRRGEINRPKPCSPPRARVYCAVSCLLNGQYKEVVSQTGVEGKEAQGCPSRDRNQDLHHHPWSGSPL